jgi:DnaJ-class molecular chaperone
MPANKEKVVSCSNCEGAGRFSVDVFRNGAHDTDDTTCQECYGSGELEVIVKPDGSLFWEVR